MKYASSKDEIKEGILEGLLNTVISVVITYGIFASSLVPVDLMFTLVAVALTAFLTGYFTLTGGGVSYFSDK